MSQLQGEHPTADSLVSEISAALRLDVVEGADPTLICFSGVRGPVDPVSIEVLETIAARLTEHPVVGLSRYTGSTFEVLLALEDAPLHAFRYRRDEFKLADPERGWSMSLGCRVTNSASGFCSSCARPRTERTRFVFDAASFHLECAVENHRMCWRLYREGSADQHRCGSLRLRIGRQRTSGATSIHSYSTLHTI